MVFGYGNFYCKVRVRVICSFVIEYDVVGVIEYSICYVCGFCVSGMRVFDYGF